MAKGLCFGMIAALILGARSVDAQVTNPVSLLLRAAYLTLGLAPYREDLERFVLTFSLHSQADVGGDGGADRGPGSRTGGGRSVTGVPRSGSCGLGAGSRSRSGGPLSPANV